MTEHYWSESFACRKCNGASVVLPDELRDDAQLYCAKCRVHLGTWGALKEKARRVVMSEIESGLTLLARASSDIPIEQLRA